MSGHSFISNLKQKDENNVMINLQDQRQEALMKKFLLHSNPYYDRV